MDAARFVDDEMALLVPPILPGNAGSERFETIANPRRDGVNLMGYLRR